MYLPPELSALRRRPALYAQLTSTCRELERERQEVVEVEFALRGERPRLLSVRSAVCSPQAALRMAVDWAVEGRISRSEALRRVSPRQMACLLRPRRAARRAAAAARPADLQPNARGVAACPGVGVGELVLSPRMAEESVHAGRRIILGCSDVTDPRAVWLSGCQGIVICSGGVASPLAAAARRWGVPAVAGGLRLHGREAWLGERRLRAGEWLSIDGSSGEITAGLLRLVPAVLSRRARLLLEWADALPGDPDSRRVGGGGGSPGKGRSSGVVKVWANADLPEEALAARRLGAQGLGLVRTERMFLRPEALLLLRSALLGGGSPGLRDATLPRLESLQRRDFRRVLRVMRGLPVTVRLLDPPLHEFLPEEGPESLQLARALGLPVAELRRRTESLRQRNPMLGLRGCRLGLLLPEIYEMQTRALAEAAAGMLQRGQPVRARIMVPLVSSPAELEVLAGLIRRVLAETSARQAVDLRVPVGVMIETPRAALCAGRLAETAEFFGFGTNDLTQLCFGFSRDDAGEFLPVYLAKRILPADPFRALDEEGVGELLRIAVSRGRRARPDLQCSLCGEQAGEPATIAFCAAAGIEHVSCSAYRIAPARLAAARLMLGQVDRPE